MTDKELRKQKKDFKSWFEANYLDGDDVYDCGKAMLSAEDVYEGLSEYLALHRQQGIKLPKKKEVVFALLNIVEDGVGQYELEKQAYNQAIDDVIALNKDGDKQ